jgi:DNA ligase D-like protein (predicted 3'-phosphoesterase)
MSTIIQQPIFVIRQHSERTPPYEFQLEIQRVLKNWGLEEGPTVDPSRNRPALPLADQSLDEAMREGLMPFGEFTNNTTLVWDTGIYRNLRAEREAETITMAQALAEGNIKVWLEGQKLRGGFELVRATTGTQGAEVWQLSKMDDIGAGIRRDITGTMPESVVSGHTLEEITESG